MVINTSESQYFEPIPIVSGKGTSVTVSEESPRELGAIKTNVPSNKQCAVIEDSDEEIPSYQTVSAPVKPSSTNDEKSLNVEESSQGEEDDPNVFVVEEIVAKQLFDGNLFYYVKWNGYPESDNSWEPESNIIDKELIEKFEKNANYCQSASSYTMSGMPLAGKNTKKRKTITPVKRQIKRKAAQRLHLNSDKNFFGGNSEDSGGNGLLDSGAKKYDNDHDYDNKRLSRIERLSKQVQVQEDVSGTSSERDSDLESDSGVRSDSDSEPEIDYATDVNALFESSNSSDGDFSRQNTSSEYHQTICDICNKKIGKFVFCSVCSISCHVNCLSSKVYKSGTSFICSHCKILPKCTYCHESFIRSPHRTAVMHYLRCLRCYDTFHLECLPIKNKEACLSGRYLCVYCIMYPFQVESIILGRLVTVIEPSVEVLEKDKELVEYYVKFVGKGHLFNAWVKENWLKQIAPMKIVSYYKNGNTLQREESISKTEMNFGTEIEKILYRKKIETSKQGAKHGISNYETKDEYEVLIKWKGLPYEGSTWELESAVESIEARRKNNSLPQGDELLPDNTKTHCDYKTALHTYTKMLSRMSLMLKSKTHNPPRDITFRELTSQPSYITGTLFSHQFEGLNWLIYNYLRRQNCIIADEMGLGKTFQTLAFLSYLFTEFQVRPFLVIVPTSVCENWRVECAKFTPNLFPLVYSGAIEDRNIIRKYELWHPSHHLAVSKERVVKPDLVITSYAIAMKDVSHLQKISWGAVVIDEGHRLKGSDALLPTLLAHIKSGFRMLLTGTPLQNNLRELFNILRFLDSKKFNDPEALEKEFSAVLSEDSAMKENFACKRILSSDADPKECESNANLGISSFNEDNGPISTNSHIEPLALEKYTKLHELLRPLILRRTKADLPSLVKLPPKVEFIVPVSMSSVQKSLYKSILETNSSRLLEHLRRVQGSDKKIPKELSNGPPSGALNNVLAELRKCLNHPYLVSQELEDVVADLSDNDKLARLVEASGKLVIVDKLLGVLLARGHRVLIFSQFTSTLDILEDYLNYKKLGFCRLDGSTPASTRQQLINTFNGQIGPIDIAKSENVSDSTATDKTEKNVFLLSTRAGGMGINLTSADTILLYDSDYNPHNDMQALSRCHRFGQLKPVLVLKLVTRHSVEEKILSIAKKKLVLDQLVVANLRNDSIGNNEAKENNDISPSSPIIGPSSMAAGTKGFNGLEMASIIQHGTKEIFSTGEDGEDVLIYDDAAIESLLEKRYNKEDPGKEETGKYGHGLFSGFHVAKIWRSTLTGELADDSILDSTSGIESSGIEATQYISSESGTGEFWKNWLEKAEAELLVQQEKDKLMSEDKYGKGKRTRKNAKFDLEHILKSEHDNDDDDVYCSTGDHQESSDEEEITLKGEVEENICDPMRQKSISLKNYPHPTRSPPVTPLSHGDPGFSSDTPGKIPNVSPKQLNILSPALAAPTNPPLCLPPIPEVSFVTEAHPKFPGQHRIYSERTPFSFQQQQSEVLTQYDQVLAYKYKEQARLNEIHRQRGDIQTLPGDVFIQRALSTNTSTYSSATANVVPLTLPNFSDLVGSKKEALHVVAPTSPPMPLLHGAAMSQTFQQRQYQQFEKYSSVVAVHKPNSFIYSITPIINMYVPFKNEFIVKDMSWDLINSFIDKTKFIPVSEKSLVKKFLLLFELDRGAKTNTSISSSTDITSVSNFLADSLIPMDARQISAQSVIWLFINNANLPLGMTGQFFCACDVIMRTCRAIFLRAPSEQLTKTTSWNGVDTSIGKQFEGLVVRRAPSGYSLADLRETLLQRDANNLLQHQRDLAAAAANHRHVAPSLQPQHSLPPYDPSRPTFYVVNRERMSSTKLVINPKPPVVSKVSEMEKPYEKLTEKAAENTVEMLVNKSIVEKSDEKAVEETVKPVILDEKKEFSRTTKSSSVDLTQLTDDDDDDERKTSTPSVVSPLAIAQFKCQWLDCSFECPSFEDYKNHMVLSHLNIPFINSFERSLTEDEEPVDKLVSRALSTTFLARDQKINVKVDSKSTLDTFKLSQRLKQFEELIILQNRTLFIYQQYIVHLLGDRDRLAENLKILQEASTFTNRDRIPRYNRSRSVDQLDEDDDYFAESSDLIDDISSTEDEKDTLKISD